MPTNFRCRACALQFAVGWSHDQALETGYGASSRLVCTRCGTEHAVRIALRDRGPERHSYFDVSLESLVDGKRLEAMQILRNRFDMSLEEAKEALESIPLSIARRIDRQLASELAQLFSPVAGLVMTEVDSEPNPMYGPLRSDLFLSGRTLRFGNDETLDELEVKGQAIGPNNEFDLDLQPCAGCGVSGSFAADPASVGAHCPHCGEDAVERVESWTT